MKVTDCIWLCDQHGKPIGNPIKMPRKAPGTMHLNIYVRGKDKATLDRLRAKLNKERKSISAFLIEAAELYVGKEPES